ncbi:MAG: WYL domain-containing protein [Actinomycetota bacterium]|nr:WYL domain-containing protein [Actinomycetota bacterium]
MSSVRTASRLNRLLGMLPWVIAHPGTTVDEVCTRFGYDRRTLAADLNLVFVCGLPGYGPDDLMVAYIDDDEVVVEMADYFSDPMQLTAPEALGLISSGLAMLSTGEAPEALRRAVDKLAAVMFPDAGDVLTVDLPEPGMAGELRRAAADGMVMHLMYTAIAGDRTTERDIEPWTVFSTLGNWYVTGFCRLAGDARVFRIDRIRSLRAVGERFQRPAETPPPLVSYNRGDDDVMCLIRLGPRARWVTDYYPVDVVDDAGDGGPVTIRFFAGDASVAARLLLRLGGDAELVEGDEVAAAVADLRRRILARYQTLSE